ncbi:hypothetical protein [Aliihoeflea sp. 40Bstr573]|uniref:hypothetical protein n=1 Tax=Aliihoeflea sp. 40Bstr573 TaxID=2696467 RepID=UPI002094D171|nr:hypothetical protein [Aliihoeflea sp. 40Bstr573]MCO6387744.1 hypothetical protein [Aliihoeflea sp. 40Bstr573]
MFKRLFKRLPYIESLRAFLEQWGLWSILSWAGSLMFAAATGAWAWVESSIPLWAAAVVFIVVFAAMLCAANFGYGLHLKRKQSRAIDQAVTIDRDLLADELEDLSRKIAALVGEYRGPMQEAWWRDTANSNPASMRESHSRIEGQMIEKYSYRHAADAWRLIRRASKVVAIDQSELWGVSHGVRSEHDVINIYMLLAQLSDDVRSPKIPLPMTDRRMAEHKARAEAAAPRLLTGTEGKTPQ